MANSDSGWYAVRCVFRLAAGAAPGPPDPAPGQSAYQERITLWSATSADEAIERGEEEARRYQGRSQAEYLGIAQSYRLVDELGEGAEVFAMVRTSELESDPYLDTFFDTGDEYQPED
jgi:hypothetical protein